MLLRCRGRGDSAGACILNKRRATRVPRRSWRQPWIAIILRACGAGLQRWLQSLSGLRNFLRRGLATDMRLGRCLNIVGVFDDLKQDCFCVGQPLEDSFGILALPIGGLAAIAEWIPARFCSRRRWRKELELAAHCRGRTIPYEQLIRDSMAWNGCRPRLLTQLSAR